ncbi:MAG: hypothetical protein JNK47_10295 [Mesorhizobium sp.]|nr:hypothetical protein [Mesorhizobium sp.]MBL8577607.1 hypothetical protein [Mesorhizobium sp.]
MTNAISVRRNAALDDGLSDAHPPFEATDRKDLARHLAADADDDFLQVDERLLPRDE